jgi:hypothetical protein
MGDHGMPKQFDPMNRTTEEARNLLRISGLQGGWLVGKNEDATRMPHFDHSPPSSKMRR